MSDSRSTRDRTISTLAELIHEQSSRPWERSCVLAADLYDALPRDERKVLELLATVPHRVVNKADLILPLSGRSPRPPATTRTVDSAAVRLRATIESATGARLVANIWGVGYRLAPAEFVSQLPAVDSADRPRLATSYGAVHGLPREPGDDHYGLS